MTCPYWAVAKVEIMPTDACQFFYECTGYGTKLKPKSVIWIIALIWMGTARMLNARSCTRTHCRYIGPYYLAMDRTRDGAWCGGRHHRHTWMGLFGRDHPRWQRADMVGHRTRWGKLSQC
ncbi:hypothetical protein [Bradyrhizobium sp. Leo121]|uniref:hypothetical protein n=1 Tax=Bradyrhizobium sp. Leo121 TaxID=1571195 RepID=UPI0024C02894|nr:hypothetical protein [Bradyrhizobium sp. Leo121]